MLWILSYSTCFQLQGTFPDPGILQWQVNIIIFEGILTIIGTMVVPLGWGVPSCLTPKEPFREGIYHHFPYETIIPQQHAQVDWGPYHTTQYLWPHHYGLPNLLPPRCHRNVPQPTLHATLGKLMNLRQIWCIGIVLVYVYLKIHICIYIYLNNLYIHYIYICIYT